ncbi:MAG: HAMP domain-containing sensor histidine kinase [Xanthomonadales bacterium]|nr:HAMP domain-containing sensor histidine kinase [Xanthomonadales bacterium]
MLVLPGNIKSPHFSPKRTAFLQALATATNFSPARCAAAPFPRPYPGYGCNVRVRYEFQQRCLRRRRALSTVAGRGTLGAGGYRAPHIFRHREDVAWYFGGVMKGQERIIPYPSGPDEHRRAILSHEVGTVLNGLLGMADVLARSGLNGEQSNWLNAIQESGLQLQRLVESFAMTAGTEDWPTARIKKFDGDALIEQLLRSHTPAALAKGNRLVLIYDPLLPRRWYGDPCGVRQLLDNLLSNAIRHTSSGLVVLETSVLTAAGQHGAGIHFSVTDTGSGIRVAEAGRIFEAYRQSQSGVSAEPGGRGLGLHICERIVATMQGRIWTETPRAAGACFRVSLPSMLIDGELREHAPKSVLFEPLHCFLALRDPMLKSVRGMLRRLGIRCCEEESANSGLGAEPERLCIRVLETHSGIGAAGYRLRFEPLAPADPAVILTARSLTAPVLVSTLAPALMAMVLEWRQAVAISERPG